jgi:hypothetical protein
VAHPKRLKAATAGTVIGLRDKRLGRQLGPNPTITAQHHQAAAPRPVDSSNHSLCIYDGATRVGSLVERAGVFTAYDHRGHLIGSFRGLRAAARSIPTVTLTNMDPVDRRAPASTQSEEE